MSIGVNNTMKFKLNNILSFRLEDEGYNKFKNYGFTFNEGSMPGTIVAQEKEIEINNIQDLIKIIDYFGHKLIVDNDSITIYDHYCE